MPYIYIRTHTLHAPLFPKTNVPATKV